MWVKSDDVVWQAGVGMLVRSRLTPNVCMFASRHNFKKLQPEPQKQVQQREVACMCKLCVQVGYLGDTSRQSCLSVAGMGHIATCMHTYM